MLEYAGMIIIVDDLVMSDIVEDWSNVRSKSRGERRRRRGFRQNIRTKRVPKTSAYQFGGKIVMHSEMLKKLKAFSA